MTFQAPNFVVYYELLIDVLFYFLIFDFCFPKKYLSKVMDLSVRPNNANVGKHISCVAFIVNCRSHADHLNELKDGEEKEGLCQIRTT